MKATGIVRPVDELGRVVLPKELRRIMDINEKDGMEIFVENDKIILRKYQPCCTFCGSLDNVVHFQEKLVCNKCIDGLIKARK